MAHDHGDHAHDHSQNDAHNDAHGYAHSHRHSHLPADFGGAFAAATLLNLALVAVQVIYGLSAHSIALLADAGHNFGDALALLLAWGAHVLARRLPTERFTVMMLVRPAPSPGRRSGALSIPARSPG